MRIIKKYFMSMMQRKCSMQSTLIKKYLVACKFTFTTFEIPLCEHFLRFFLAFSEENPYPYKQVIRSNSHPLLIRLFYFGQCAITSSASSLSIFKDIIGTILFNLLFLSSYATKQIFTLYVDPEH